MVVGGRWFYFILSLMCTSHFGKYVFPAWHAMTRPASLAFISFLFMVVIAALQTYLTFPIKENDPISGSAWLAFMKVFKFALLGDFDVWELEGVDAVVEGNMSHRGGVNAEIDDGKPSEVYNDGVMIFAMIITVTVSILSMNVAIGLVSSLYEEAKANANQIYSHFKAGYLFKMMTQRYFVSRFWDCCWPCKTEPASEKEKESFVISITKQAPSVEQQMQGLQVKLDDFMKLVLQQQQRA